MNVLYILLCVAFASGFYVDSNGTHENKIFEGDHVRIEDVPYQASLMHWMGIDNICGATIIHEFWVVTAAHCVINVMHISVRTGTQHRNKRLGKVYNSEEIIKHERYNTSNDNNDIALIKLSERIKFNDKQQPIALAKPHDIPRVGDVMQVSGFGKIGENLGYSDILKAAHVPVVSERDCLRVYGSEEFITDNMFCGGSEDADTCEGDSGGPGIIHGKLYGITSSGIYCGVKVFPGVYTRVHKYYNWIEEKTGLRF